MEAAIAVIFIIVFIPAMIWITWNVNDPSRPRSSGAVKLSEHPIERAKRDYSRQHPDSSKDRTDDR